MAKTPTKAKRAPRKKGAGRPEFKPTAAQREQVEILLAARLSEEDIARSLGIARMTLRKHFQEELRDGHTKRNTEMLMAMFRSGVSGNVAAQKAWLARVEMTPKPLSAAKKKAPKLGKKEQATLDAQVVPENSDWSELVGPDRQLN